MFYEKWLMIDYWLSAFRDMCNKLHKKRRALGYKSVGFGSMCRASPKERRAGGCKFPKIYCEKRLNEINKRNVWGFVRCAP